MSVYTKPFSKDIDCPHCGSTRVNMVRTSQWAWPMDCTWHEGININADMLCINCDRYFVLSVKSLEDAVSVEIKYEAGDEDGN